MTLVDIFITIQKARDTPLCSSPSSDGTPKRSAKLVRVLRPEVDSDFEVGPALFGPDIGENEFQVSAELVEPKPYDGCSAFSGNDGGDNDDYTGKDLKGKIFLITRGGCLFVQKVSQSLCNKIIAISTIIVSNSLTLLVGT